MRTSVCVCVLLVLASSAVPLITPEYQAPAHVLVDLPADGHEAVLTLGTLAVILEEAHRVGDDDPAVDFNRGVILVLFCQLYFPPLLCMRLCDEIDRDWVFVCVCVWF